MTLVGDPFAEAAERYKQGDVEDPAPAATPAAADAGDPFAAAAARFKQQAQLPVMREIQQLPVGDSTFADGTTVSKGTGSEVIPLADAQPAPEHTTISGGPAGVTATQGFDPFTQAAARFKVAQARESGDNMEPALREASRVGAYDHSDITQFPLRFPEQPEQTTIGGLAGAAGGTVPQAIDYPTWQQLRHNFQVDYPTRPLPPELQVFDFAGDHHTPDGQQIPLDQLQQYAFNNTDRPLLHDAQMEQEAKAKLAPGAAVPEVLQGTQEQRTLALARSTVKQLRQHYGPQANSVSDADLLQLDGKVMEQHARDLIVSAIRQSDMGHNLVHVSDEQILHMAQEEPGLYRDQIAHAMLPKLAADAAARMQKRQDLGAPIAGDESGQAANDPLLVQAAHQQQLGNDAAAAVGRHAIAGAMAQWIGAADLGLPGLVARLGGSANKERYDAFMQQYQGEHPWTSLIMSTAGYLTPGSPAWFMGRMLGNAGGNAIRSGVAGALGEETSAAALKSILGEVAPNAFNEAGALTNARLAGSLAANTVEMPLYNAAQKLLEGNPKGAAESIDFGNPQTREGTAKGVLIGAGIGEGLHALTSLGGFGRALYDRYQYSQKLGQPFEDALKDAGIEVTDKAALLRIVRWQENIHEKGMNPVDAAAKAGVSGKDVKAAFDLARAIKQAKANPATDNSTQPPTKVEAREVQPAQPPAPAPASPPDTQPPPPPAPPAPPPPPQQIHILSPAGPPASGGVGTAPTETTAAIAGGPNGNEAEAPTPADHIAKEVARLTKQMTDLVHPPELADAHAVGEWYGATFHDQAGAPAIEALASMKRGGEGRRKYVLADVPIDQIDNNSLQPGDVDQAKVKGISELSEADRANLKPAILVALGEQLTVADGVHRLEGTRLAGGKTLRAYVPEEFVGTNGITRAGAPAETTPPATSEGTTPAAQDVRTSHDAGDAIFEHALKDHPELATIRASKGGGDEQAAEQASARASERPVQSDDQEADERGGGTSQPAPTRDSQGVAEQSPAGVRAVAPAGARHALSELRRLASDRPYADGMRRLGRVSGEQPYADAKDDAQRWQLVQRVADHVKQLPKIKDPATRDKFIGAADAAIAFARIEADRLEPAGGDAERQAFLGKLEKAQALLDQARGTIAGDGLPAAAEQPNVERARETPAREPSAPPAPDAAGRKGQADRGSPADQAAGGRDVPSAPGVGTAGAQAGDVERGREGSRDERPGGTAAGRGERPGGQPDAADAAALDRPSPEGLEPAGGRDAADRRVEAGPANHHIAPQDVLAPAGDVTKTNANIRAIKLLKQLEDENRAATPAEQKALAQYVGWGGLPGAFDQVKADKRHLANLGRLGSDELTNLQNWEKRWGKHYDQLKELLTPEEWNAAARSTINAHYTSRDVIDAMWQMVKRMGFAGGPVLENSAGVGHFIGLEPPELARRSRWTAVERDSISGRILAKLYPQAIVQRVPFEQAKVPANSQSLIIGNVPFAKEGPRDTKYPKASLHNYFLMRSIDLLQPGQLMAEITSSSTLDSGASLKAREWIAERADLVAAFRLPNDAFKGNAGTEVTTDILIFRKKDGLPFAQANAFRDAPTMKTHDGASEIPVNEYYHAHPDHLLGLVSTEGTMYGANEPALLPKPGVSLKQQLAGAIDRVPADVAASRTRAQQPAEDTTPAIAAAEVQKENSYQLQDGEVRQVRGRMLVKPEWATTKGKTFLPRAKDWVAVRDAAKQLLALQLDPEAAEKDVETARRELNKAYDTYNKRHGDISDTRKTSFLNDDPEYPVTLALEYIEQKLVKVKAKDGSEAEIQRPHVRKADIFTKRTIFPRTAPTRADNIADAIAISESWRNGIDLPYVASLLNVTPEQARDDALAKGVAFEDPDSGRLVSPDEYLSGNVREKLAAAKQAAADAAIYKPNVDALEKVQPAPLKMGQISLRLGSTWVPGKIIGSWISDLFGITDAATVQHIPAAGTWTVQWHPAASNSAKARDVYAGGGVNATELIEEALNMKAAVAFDTVAGEDGKAKQVKNPERTVAAQAAQEKLQQMYQKWVKQSEHVPELERIYNENYNSIALRSWKGPDFDVYPNAADVVKLQAHQKAAVSRGTRESYLLAHAVGTGKTYTFITTAMEWKRLALGKKPMLVAQNSTVEQIIESFKRLYPWANVLAPTEADFSSTNRKRLLSRIATGDYDAVVVAHSQFDLIEDDPGRVRAYIEQRLDELREALADAQPAGSNSRGWSRDPTVKELQKAIDRLEKRLGDLAERKTDRDMLTFEQLGVDGLIVDEAHRYKKLEFASQMDPIKGLDRGYSERGFGLFMKTRFIQERNGGRNVILATGTPITNTLAEAWNMLRYVRPDLLRSYHIENFDDFASLFTAPVTQLEMSAVGWKMETRLASFTNADELVKLFRSGADVINAEEVDLPRPGLKGGKAQTVSLKATGALRSYMDFLIETYRAWTKLPGKEKREQSHVPLVITGLAKRAAIDLRLVDPKAQDLPGSKLEAAADRIAEIYKQHEAVKGTQIVFADVFQSADTGKDSDRFNLFHDLKRKLVERGIPAKEIENIYDHDTKKARPLLFDKINSGDVRVVMGSTEKLGVGVNIQRLLAALHHLDAPWRPADIEQREGRILRQGNQMPEVQIFRYGVENTFDAGLWQRLATKQRFINQVLRGEIPGRTFEDAAAEVVASFDEAAAFISGNPLVMEKIGGESRMRSLEAQRYQHEQQVIDARQKVRGYERQIPLSKESAQGLRKLQGELLAKLDADPVTGTVDGKKYEGKELNKALEAHVAKVLADVKRYAAGAYSNTPIRKGAGSVIINGVEFELNGLQNMSPDTGKPMGEPDIEWSIPNKANAPLHSTVTTGSGLVNSAKRVVPNRLASGIQQHDAFVTRAMRETGELEEFAKQPFEHEQEYQTLKKRLEEIEGLLAQEAPAEHKGEDAPPVGDLVDDGGEDGSKPYLDHVKDQVKQLDPAKPLVRDDDGHLTGRDRHGGYVLLPNWLGRGDEQSPHKFEDGEIEQRFQEAKLGVQLPPLRERLMQQANEFWASLARPFPKLPIGARYAEAKRVLLALRKQKGVRSHDAVKAMDQVLAGLDRKAYDLFTRSVLLDDLMEEVEIQTGRGILWDQVTLPFGFDATTATAAHDKISKALADPAAAAAKFSTARRYQLWRSVKQEYIGAMKAIGFDEPEKKLLRESYFRHQVLMYANARGVAGPGGDALRTPTGRGFLKARRGSELDINANYLQAEFEVMAQMMYDTQVARAIKQMQSFYDIVPNLKKEAQDQNYTNALKSLELMAQLQATTPEKLYRQIYNWKVAKGFEDLYRLAAQGDLPDTAGGTFAALIQAMADLHQARQRTPKNDPKPNLDKKWHSWLWRYGKYVLGLDDNAADGAKLAFKTLFKGKAEKKKMLQEQLGKDYVEWRNLIPKDYELWQPRQGTQFYLADSIPQRIANDLLTGVLQEVKIDAGMLKKVLAKASPFAEMALPRELAQTLDSFFHRPDEGWVGRTSRQLLDTWKEYVLMNPRRALKFNIRNASGDADATFAFNPSAFKFLPQAAKELVGVLKQGKPMSAEMRQWFERGGMQTLLAVQELPEVDQLELFRRFEPKRGMTTLMKRAWSLWWRKARGFANGREAILRYANFLSYLQQVKSNAAGRPDSFGASIPEEVMGLSNPVDRAFLMSNDVVGSHDAVGETGQFIRRHVYPFWSYTESNFRRYWRGFKNASRDGETAHTLGRLLLRKAASPYTYYRVGKFFLKAAALWAGMTAWNWLMHRKEEEDLPPTLRVTPHIILGRDANGKVLYFNKLGALSDLMDWFGVDETPTQVRDYLNGRKDLKDVAEQMALAPARKLLEGISPFYKIPAELITRRRMFPDPFNPRLIRDRADYVAQSLSLEHEFRALSDRPAPAYWRSWLDLGLYRADPDAAAYYDLLDEKELFLKRIGKGDDAGDYETPRSEALREYKSSLRFGDKDAAARYLQEYALLGGTRENLNKSLKAMAPFGGMAHRDATAFYQTLSAEERLRVGQADRYYHDVLLGTDVPE